MPRSPESYVTSFSELFKEGIQHSEIQQAPPPLTSQRPLVAMISPHPDDECLVAGVALRLRQEVGAQLVNIPLSYGSNPETWPRRTHELTQACAQLGMALHDVPPGSFGHIYISERMEHFAEWRKKTQLLSSILAQLRPEYLMFPHAHDGHPAHVGTHFLVMDALAMLPDYSCQLVLTEWWHANEHPNTLIELSTQHVTTMLQGLCAHRGEIARNPYHLRLPASLMEQVRRGVEMVGARDTPVQNFVFGQLLDVQKYSY